MIRGFLRGRGKSAEQAGNEQRGQWDELARPLDCDHEWYTKWMNRAEVWRRGASSDRAPGKAAPGCSGVTGPRTISTRIADTPREEPGTGTRRSVGVAFPTRSNSLDYFVGGDVSIDSRYVERGHLRLNGLHGILGAVPTLDSNLSAAPRFIKQRSELSARF